MLKLVITCDLREIGGEINVKPATFGLCEKPDKPSALDLAPLGPENSIMMTNRFFARFKTDLFIDLLGKHRFISFS